MLKQLVIVIQFSTPKHESNAIMSRYWSLKEGLKLLCYIVVLAVSV
ncbi:MAG: hypothetical protein ACI854_002566 [Arenicella sp.]|jgi:hypothetical protein